MDTLVKGAYNLVKKDESGSRDGSSQAFSIPYSLERTSAEWTLKSLNGLLMVSNRSLL